MNYITKIVKDLFVKISNQSHIEFNYSPLICNIEDTNGSFDAYYGFYSTGAVRIETNGDEIIGVSIYNNPRSLNSPSYRINLNNIDPNEEIDTIVAIMLGRGDSLVRKVSDPSITSKDSIFESNREDIDSFMKSIGGYAYNKKISSLYHSFLQWASVTGHKEVSSAYFSTLAHEWLIVNGKGKYEHIKVTKGSEEKTNVNSAQEDEFIDEIYNNEVYYKAEMAEHAVKRMMMNDALINALFLCGSPGMGKTTLVLDTIKQFKDYNSKIVYKKGTIKGFTGLLQLLWDYRKNKVIILDDCDNLLKDNEKNFSAISILKAALETQQNGRIISYVRAKKKPIPTTESIKENIENLIEVSSWFDATSDINKNYTNKNADNKKSEISNEDDPDSVPDEFLFESKMIFISNKTDIPETIGDRCLAIQLNYTKDQALKIIETKLDSLCPEYPDLSLEDKKLILKFMKQHKAQATTISFRTFIHIAVLFMSHDPHWMQWALIQLKSPISD
jgi:hypothetical protein